jgi:hypothetical protein
MTEIIESWYFRAIVGFLIGGMFMYALKRISRNQVAAEALMRAQFGTLSKLIKDTSTPLYNEVSNIWLEMNRAKIRPQFCTLLLMTPAAVIKVPKLRFGRTVNAEEPEESEELSKPMLMSTTVWLGPDQDHCFSFQPDVIIPAGTIIVVTGPCTLVDVVVANNSQSLFTGSLGQVAILRDSCSPAYRMVIRIKGWQLRPSTMSEAELVRQSALRALPPWEKPESI